jgi:hypothetical protein
VASAVAVAALPVTAPVIGPANPVAVSTPVLELNVRFVPLLGGRPPVAAVTNKGKHSASLDSSATVTFVAVVAVVAAPTVKPEAVPVKLVATPDAGVPNAGVTNVGELDNTTLPVPVFDVTPVPPCATATVVPSQVPVPIVPTEVI